MATFKINGKNFATQDGTGAATVHSDVVFPAGHVIQIVQNTYDTDISITRDGTYQSINLSQAITPTSDSSKILVFGQASGFARLDTTNTGEVGFGIFAGGSLVYESETITRTQDNSSTYYAPTYFSVNYLHSPSTDSEITYEIKGKGNSALHVFTFNRDSSNSSIILLEISG